MKIAVGGKKGSGIPEIAALCNGTLTQSAEFAADLYCKNCIKPLLSQFG